MQRTYRKLLGRSPDTTGSAYWASRLDAGDDRSTIVGALCESLECRRRRVTAAYQALLDRSPDSSGRDFCATVTLAPGDIALRRYLAASNEYFNLAQE